MRHPTLPWARRYGIVLVAAASVLGCDSLPHFVGGLDVSGQPEIRCGRFEGPDCNDLLELGLDAVAGARPEVPLIVAVGGACPDNARCMPSALGGEEAAVVVRWPDGTMDRATIPLPPDWPAGAPGQAIARDGLPPEHLQALVGAGG